MGSFTVPWMALFWGGEGRGTVDLNIRCAGSHWIFGCLFVLCDSLEISLFFYDCPIETQNASFSSGSLQSGVASEILRAVIRTAGIHSLGVIATSERVASTI